jgi:hypothetical protein
MQRRASGEEAGAQHGVVAPGFCRLRLSAPCQVAVASIEAERCRAGAMVLWLSIPREPKQAAPLSAARDESCRAVDARELATQVATRSGSRFRCLARPPVLP